MVMMMVIDPTILDLVKGCRRYLQPQIIPKGTKTTEPTYKTNCINIDVFRGFGLRFVPQL